MTNEERRPDLHRHRALTGDRARASQRVRSLSTVAGAGAVLAAVGLTVALVPHGAATAAPAKATSTTGTTTTTVPSTTTTTTTTDSAPVTSSGGS
jgi:hypothetical protein